MAVKDVVQQVKNSRLGKVIRNLSSDAITAGVNTARSVDNAPFLRIPFSPTIGSTRRSIMDNVIRPVPRAIQTLSSSVGQAIGADDGVTSPEEITRAMPYKPARDFFYGENPEPILSLQNQTANNAPRNASWLQDRGVSPEIAQGVSTPLTFLGIAGIAGLDAVPNDPSDFLRAGGKVAVKEGLPLVDDVAREGKKVAPVLDEVLQVAKTTLNPDPLMAEAKKHGSVEEFVKGEGLYTALEGGYDPSRVGVEGAGVSLSRDKKVADIYATIGRKTQKVYLSKNAKILKNPPEKFIQYTNGAFGDFNPDTELYAYAKSKGYDAIDKTSNIWGMMGGEAEITVINPKVLKTKSQLTDIWNQAQKSQQVQNVVKAVESYRKK